MRWGVLRVSATPGTITEAELADYLESVNGQRRDSAEDLAKGALRYALRNREPDYEPGVMYRDADGTSWLFAPGQAEAREGSWRDCPWLKPGDHAAYSLSSPKQPLRKLVPEGQHEQAAALVAEWRGLGEQDGAMAPWRAGYRAALRKCADELGYALKSGGRSEH